MKIKIKKNELNKFRTCLTVEDNEVIATPVGLVHSKDFVRNVFVGKFNEALIYFSQVQTKLKNHPLSQEARFKVAQTSYFKGDFK